MPANWHKMASYLLDNTDSEWLATCEDDIEWSADSFQLTCDHLKVVGKDVGLVSPYTSYPCGNGYDMWNEPKIPRAWNGNLAMFYRRELLQKIVNSFQEMEGKKANLDIFIGNKLTLLDYKIHSHMPTLIYHLGYKKARNSVVEKNRSPYV